MPDLNKLMVDIQKSSSDIEVQLKTLFGKYESLYHDANSQFTTERIASSGSMDGLENFYHLVQVIRRNKDVMGSLVRGISNLRSISNFKFVEEEVPKPVPKPKKTKKRPVSKPPEPPVEPVEPSETESEPLVATEEING